MSNFWEEYRTPALIASGVLLVIGLIVYAVTYRAETQARATRFTWMRAINIERWQTVEESAWEVPPTGRELRNYRAIHHWEDYISGWHEECRTVGTGKDATRKCETVYEHESRPVYRTKYDYLIDRWVVVKTPTMQGDGQSPIWPDTTDIQDEHAPPRIGDERAGQRISRYTTEFVNSEGKRYQLDFAEERWRGFRPGTAYTVILDIFGRALDVRSYMLGEATL